VNFITKNSKKLGIINGKFYPCPKTPNCVSTQSADDMHKIQPIAYTTLREEVMEKIIKIVQSMKRTSIITKKDNYIHATFKSRIFRFVDDVEFYFDDKEKIVHFKSASRVGHSDLGVNRKRMEEIRKRFNIE
jgi:uncharacterized protein (DUF1499 family)